MLENKLIPYQLYKIAKNVTELSEETIKSMKRVIEICDARDLGYAELYEKEKNDAII